MPESFSTQMQDAIGKLRRGIHDTDSEDYLYEDSDLYFHIGDAAADLNSEGHITGISVGVVDDNGDFVDSQGNSRDVPSSDVVIIVKKAQINILRAEKSQSDRDSVDIDKKNLSVRMSVRSGNYAGTLTELEKELRRLLFRRNNDISGVRVE